MQPYCLSPHVFIVDDIVHLFFRFAINLRGKILNPVEFMVQVHPK